MFALEAGVELVLDELQMCIRDRAHEEVRLLGAADSATRTADQTQIARFWADGAGTITPPGHWNQIAQTVAQSSSLSLVEEARLFALLNIAEADAAILCWDTKYSSNFWRPITAIRAVSYTHLDVYKRQGGFW